MQNHNLESQMAIFAHTSAQPVSGLTLLLNAQSTDLKFINGLIVLSPRMDKFS